MSRHLDQSAFVVHARDYGETSQILEVLTRDRGRLALLHKGARKARRGSTMRMQPFTRYRLGWTGRAQLRTLIQPESEHFFVLRGDRLAAGFYLNELIWYLTRHEDESRDLFDAYQRCLFELAAEEMAIDISLRRFERRLLDILGYGVPWDIEAIDGVAIDPQGDYYFRLGEGFFRSPGPGDLALRGSVVLALAADDYREPQARQAAKQLFRQMLDQLLQGRELRSRSLLAQRGQK